MKIVYFSDTFYPKVDGVAISMKNFAERLSLRGHEFLIFCPEYGEGDFHRINDHIRVERFTSAFLPSYPDIKVVLPSPIRLKHLIKEFQPDIAHIHTPGLMGVYGMNLMEKYAIPTVGTYHTLMAEQDMYVSFYRLFKMDKLFMRLEKFKDPLSIKELIKFEKMEKLNIRKKIILKICNNLYDRCDLVVSPSELLKQQLQEYGLHKPIQVISNGMDLNRFKGEVKTLTKSAPKILHVGRISYEKNCDVIVQAFRLIHNQNPQATLTIIGDGPAIPSLKLQAQSYGIENSVIFQGFVDNAKLPEIYPQYDAFITASTMETQGLVILEAIACGLPAIGVRSYAIPELIHHGENGYIAEPFDFEGIAKETLKLLSDPETYTRFSKRSIEISKHHEIGQCVDKMEEMYKALSVLQGKKKKTNLLNMMLGF